jgi:N-acetylneuraminic acid mutarotase
MNTRHVNKVMVVAVLSGVASMSSVAEGAWKRKPDMPTARAGLSASVVDGKIYAIGGGAPVTTVEQYDPATDTWTKKADMRIPRVFFSTSVVNGKIYAIGGYGSGGAFLSSLEEYDPLTNSWTSKAHMSVARKFFTSSVANGKIYVMGGKDTSGGATPIVEEYNPATDTWTKKANILTARGNMSCSTVNGIIYAIGGGQVQGGAVEGTVEAYDPSADTWTTKASMPTARGFFSTCVVNGKIFAIGGCRDPYNSSELSSVEMYDPATDTWTIMDDMPTARKALATASVDGKIYAIGGQPVAGWGASLSTVEEYSFVSPAPDFNGDGLVGMTDLLRVVESWEQNDPFADIAPPPFGDGVVDVLDLELLMSHWKEPVDDPTLIAHWALDEIEGGIASDSTGTSDGYVFGDPVWIPDGGQIGGAISLDGIDDHIVTSLALNPAEGPFSVFAWVQGGAPGQIAISQFNGANWLGADPASGSLVTELCESGRGGVPLLSAVNIADGLWHRIGIVWDGLYRVIYVDDVPVAEDTQIGLGSSIGGLKIGGGIDPAQGTFWSGVIDDVRIYNRAVHP